MNKTVTINISGIIFHIEEDAFERLSQYLATIKKYFNQTEGGQEIMSDIESRIAELLSERINAAKQVIVADDVNYAMGIMGKPEDFAGDETKNQTANEPNNKSNFETGEEKIKRRLYRNPDEKAIGGVCSGMAAYFDVDTVWVRLAMFLLIFFGGLSLWVYIIMWIIIPEAKTTAEKFAMRGEQANINSIFKSFKEEAEDVKSRMNKYGQNIKNNNYANSIRSNVAMVLGTIFNIIARLFGLLLVLIGCLLLFAYIVSITGISILNSNNELAHWKTVIFASPSHYALAVLAFIIVIGVPLFMFLYSGIKLLFKIRYSNRWLNLSLGVVWTLGLFLGITITALTIKQFNQNSKIKQNVELHGLGDTIVVKLNPASACYKNLNADNADELDTHYSNNNDDYAFAEVDKKLVILGRASLNIVESSNDSVELVISKSARGEDKREANENAKSVDYSYSQEKNVLFFDELFMVTNDRKFRSQELQLKLKLPKGKIIYFDKSVKYFLNDIENTSATYEGDMVSRRWKMTDKGLSCIDCDNLKTTEKEENEEPNKKNIVINGNGIKVNGKDAEIKIDEEGIKIKELKKNKTNEDQEEKD